MQVGFYMAPEDEKCFVDHFYARGGYFIDYHKSNLGFHPVIDNIDLLPTRFFKGDDRPVLLDKVTYYMAAKSFAPLPESSSNGQTRFTSEQLITKRGFRFEMIEFTRCQWGNTKVSSGRFWLNGSEKTTVRFYRALCAYIRKSYTRDAAGFWISENFETFCNENGYQPGYEYY